MREHATLRFPFHRRVRIFDREIRHRMVYHTMKYYWFSFNKIILLLLDFE